MRLIVVAAAFTVLSSSAFGQVGSDRQSLGVDGTFAPNSSHILIGRAAQRQTWTAGIEYAVRLWQNKYVRLNYEASVSPFFRERDPTIVGGYDVVDGVKVAEYVSPTRVLAPQRSPIGEASIPGGYAPIYGIYGTEATYGGAAAPIGARLNGLPYRRLQPTFSVDLGFVVSTRTLPIDDASRFNFLFSFGPGFQYFCNRHDAIRAEYLYRHLSNADTATQNPGVDQGTIRMTLSHHW